jgi:hypothetical protein
MINKERIRKLVKELCYEQTDDKGDCWTKVYYDGDLSVRIGSKKVKVDLVCRPIREGWIFKEANTTIGAVRIINGYN